MGAKGAVAAAPAADEDARHEQNVEKASNVALQLFYDKESHESLMAMITEEDPMGGAALIAGELIQAVDEKSGGHMPDDVIFPAAMDIMSEIMEYVEGQGIHQFTEKETGLASMLLIKKLADDYGTTPEQMQDAMGELDQGDLNESDAIFKSQMNGGHTEQGEDARQEQAETINDGDEQSGGLLAMAKRG